MRLDATTPFKESLSYTCLFRGGFETMLFPSMKALNNPAIHNREQLIQALHSAAELEHILACEYLFTAFTMRRKLSDFPPDIPKSQRLVTLERSRLWLGQILL